MSETIKEVYSAFLKYKYHDVRVVGPNIYYKLDPGSFLYKRTAAGWTDLQFMAKYAVDKV